MAGIKLNLTKILTDVCDVMENAATSDDYGQATGTGTSLVLASVACRLLPLSRRAKESKINQRAGISYYSLFIMPLSNGRNVTEKFWIRINSGVNAGLYNIILAEPPVIAGAPYELYMEKVKGTS